jgi:hypothetical protein
MPGLVGETLIPATMPFKAIKVGYFDPILNTETPATVFHDSVNDIVILAIHAYELVGGVPIVTYNPMKTSTATYQFFRSHGFDYLGHPIFDFCPPPLSPVNWGEGSAQSKFQEVEVPYWLFEIACEFLAVKDKLRQKLISHGHLNYGGK